MRIPLRRFFKVALAPFLLVPIFLAGCSASSKEENTSTSSNAEIKPANTEDIFLYRGIGASFLCNARAAGVEFPKAVGIAAATYAQVLNGRHGGFVASAGKKKLTNKQLFAGAEFQIITGALQYCPKEVPEDVKAKVDTALKKQSDLDTN